MSKENRVKTIPPEETALFCDQVAMILKGGIPLRNGIETLTSNYKDSKYAAKFELINQEVQKGGSLYDGISKAGFFPAYMVNMVKVGEYTGTIDEVMESLANYYRREAQVRSSITNAILYPTVLALMMALVIAVLIVGVMPVFERVFASLGAAESAASVSAMNLGSLIGKIVLVVVGVFLIVVAVFAVLLRTRYREKAVDFLGAILPPMRRIQQTMSAARFASISEIMLKSGYNIDAAVDYGLDVITDKGSVKKLNNLKDMMADGVPFSDGVAKIGMFDSLHEKMIEMGSSVGQLDTVMHKLVDIYEQKSDNSINRVVSLIEPALVAVLSVIVGGILLAVMLPLVGILTTMI